MTQEVLDAIADLKTDFGGRLTALEEAAKPVVTVVETKTELDALEIAESLAASSLSPEGRKRVLELHRANGKPLSELIEAEEAYVKVAHVVVAEGDEREAEESAAATTTETQMPRQWGKKDK